MTLGEAKGLLRKWFRALADAATGLPGHSLDVIVLPPGTKSLRPDSPTERAVLVRAARLEPFADVARAYARLSPLHQEVLWLLYGLGVPYRDVAHRLRLKKHQIEAVNNRALAAFITALGEWVEERVCNGA
mgnify:CR=1 FL=1